MNQNLNSLIEHLKTPAGCLGGNIEGAFWLFGIEYGGKATVSDYQNLIPQKDHGVLTSTDMIKLIRDPRTSFYLNTAKLLSVIYGGSISGYEQFANKKGLGTAEGQFYFGNLGSVGFSEDYNKQEFEPIGRLLGVESKDQLKLIESEHRTALFQSWLKQHSPKCLMCFGIGNAYRFVRIFSGENEKSHCWSKVGRNNFYHEVINQERTHLFVLPHPSQSGPWCLTTDERIGSFGKVIRNILVSDGIDPTELPG